MQIAYHLVPEPWYRAQPAGDGYLPEPFDTDGFVHLTHGLDDVLAVGNLFYQGDPRPYLLLTIDLEQITADVRYDDASGRFPHVYGPLDRAAIVEMCRIERDEEGAFVGTAPFSTGNAATDRS